MPSLTARRLDRLCLDPLNHAAARAELPRNLQDAPAARQRRPDGRFPERPRAFALLRTVGWDDASTEARRAFEAAVARLAEAGIAIADHHADPAIEEVEGAIADAAGLTRQINAWEGRWPLNTYRDRDRSKLSQSALGETGEKNVARGMRGPPLAARAGDGTDARLKRGRTAPGSRGRGRVCGLLRDKSGGLRASVAGQPGRGRRKKPSASLLGQRFW